MDKNAARQESFVLRIWREQSRPGWRGWVQHARSGESAVVHSLAELVAFLEDRCGRLEDDKPQGLK